LKLSSGGNAHAIGHFDAYVCDRCGYSEFWAAGVASLVHDPSRGVHLVAGNDGPEEPEARAERSRSDEWTATRIGHLRDEIAANERELRRIPWLRMLPLLFIAVGSFLWLDPSLASSLRTAWATGVAGVFGLFLWFGRFADQRARRAKVDTLRSQLRTLEGRQSSGRL
jgi:hypothetical protein